MFRKEREKQGEDNKEDGKKYRRSEPGYPAGTARTGQTRDEFWFYLKSPSLGAGARRVRVPGCPYVGEVPCIVRLAI